MIKVKQFSDKNLTVIIQDINSFISTDNYKIVDVKYQAVIDRYTDSFKHFAILLYDEIHIGKD